MISMILPFSTVLVLYSNIGTLYNTVSLRLCLISLVVFPPIEDVLSKY